MRNLHMVKVLPEVSSVAVLTGVFIKKLSADSSNKFGSSKVST